MFVYSKIKHDQSHSCVGSPKSPELQTKSQRKMNISEGLSQVFDKALNMIQICKQTYKQPHDIARLHWVIRLHVRQQHGILDLVLYGRGFPVR